MSPDYYNQGSFEMISRSISVAAAVVALVGFRVYRNFLEERSKGFSGDEADCRRQPQEDPGGLLS
jgi:hypothetical protein